MTDAVSILKDRLAKGQAKVARIKKQLDAAEIEVSDTQTALRVLDLVFNQQSSESGGGDQSTTVTRQLDIVAVLNVGQESASAPADVFEGFKLISTEIINIDTFRTTLWRMKGKVYATAEGAYIVEGDNGLYWKRAIQEVGAPDTDGVPPPPAAVPPPPAAVPPPPGSVAAAAGWPTTVPSPPMPSAFANPNPNPNPFARRVIAPSVFEEDEEPPF